MHCQLTGSGLFGAVEYGYIVVKPFRAVRLSKSALALTCTPRAMDGFALVEDGVEYRIEYAGKSPGHMPVQSVRCYEGGIGTKILSDL